jgi:hypothetical protein
MNIAQPFSAGGVDAVKAELAGGSLVLYSCQRPASPEDHVLRNGALATFTFAAPAFDGSGAAAFVENPVTVVAVGTPGFARAYKADGTVVADFWIGTKDADLTLKEISASVDYPISVTTFKL